MPADEFDAWYQQAWPAVLKALIGSGIPAGDAEEAAAEAFSRAWARWGRLHSARNPEGWTYQVATNVVRRHHRRRAIEERLRIAERRVDVGAPAVPGPIWAAVADLAPRQREAVVLRYVVGLEQHEIAEWMDVRPGTVAATLASARSRLRAVVDLEELSR